MSIRRLFTNVLEQWLKRYLFTPGENNCSCAKDSEACRLIMCSGPIWKGGSAVVSYWPKKGGFYTLHLWEFRSRTDIWRRHEWTVSPPPRIFASWNRGSQGQWKVQYFLVTERSTVSPNEKQLLFSELSHFRIGVLLNIFVFVSIGFDMLVLASLFRLKYRYTRTLNEKLYFF